MNDSVEQTTCQVDYGSISRMPSISMCFIHHENNTKDSRLHDGAIVHCDAKSHDVIPVSSNLLCSLIQHATIIAHFKAAWLLAKNQLWPRHHQHILCTITNPAQHSYQAAHAQQPLSDSLWCSQCTVDGMAISGNLTVGH